MKNFMVANLSGKGRYNKQRLKKIVKAQIANSLDLGWSIDDIILLTNFDFEYRGVVGQKIPLNEFCWTGSKMFGIKYLFDHKLTDDVVWSRDLDLWQNVHFDCPEFKDVGACYYSRPKFNGGSIFWKPSAIDIINRVIERLTNEQAKKEEPILNEIFKSGEFSDRITVLNYTYNVGCSGYYERYTRSIKPVKACHFHPYNRIAWETHCLDRNGLGEKGISDRLEKIIREYYPEVAAEISEEGRLRSIEKKEIRKQKGLE